MPGSEEALGAGHPATYSEDDPANPNYDPVAAEKYRKEVAAKIGSHMGQLSGEHFGDQMESFHIPGRGLEPSGQSNDERD